MDTRATLHRSVCANPHDDLPRLVYADWLEENGRAERAEFIRVQCRVANASPADEDYVDLLEREAELKALLWRDLEEERPVLPHGIGWESEHRGFAERLRFADHFQGDIRPTIDRLTEVNAGVPVSGLRVNRVTTPDLEYLLRSPLARTLTSLHVDGPADGDDGQQCVAALVGTNAAPHLRRLALMGRIVRQAMRRLVESPTSRTLHELHLSNLTRVSFSAWPPGEAALRTLGLGGNHYQRGLPLTHPDWFRGIHTLMGVDALTVNENEATPFTFLAELPRLARLEVVSNSRNSCPLIEHPPVALGHLTLRGGSLTDLKQFAAQSRLSAMRVLELFGTQVLDSWYLFHSAHLRRLRNLNLSGVQATEIDVEFLPNAPFWESLTSFDWRYGPKHPAQFAKFLEAVVSPKMKHLCLRGVPIGDAGASALAGNSSLASLTRLDLAACDLGPIGVGALLNSPHLQNLIELNLYANRGGAAMSTLADLGVMLNLGLAEVAANRVPDAVKLKLSHRRCMRVY